jgi:thioredoxin reductase (NADPH)
MPTAAGLAAQQVSRRLGGTFSTSVDGVFAAGDIREGSMKRVAAAVGEGSSVIRSIHRYLSFSDPEAVRQAAQTLTRSRQ